jgi:hypothetical protein
VLPQTPAHIRSDPVVYQEWLASAQIQFKNWTPFLEAIGIFDIYNTIWFRVLLAVLSLCVLVSLANQIYALFFSSWIEQPEAFCNAANAVVLTTKTTSLDEALQKVRQALEAFLGPVEQKTQGWGTHFYGSRAKWASAASSAAYIGLLSIALGLAIDGRWGWAQANVQLLPAQVVGLGPNASHQLELVETPPGTTVNVQVEGRQQISLQQNGSQYHHGFRYHLISDDNPVVRIQAQRSDGTRLALSEYSVRPNPVQALEFTFSPALPARETDHLFIVPEAKVVGRLQWIPQPQPTDTNQHFHLWIFADGQTPIGEHEIAAGEGANTVTIGDLSFTLDISRYAVIDVAYQPGLWLLRIGSGLLVIGLLTSAIPRQQVWSIVSAQKDVVTIRIQESNQGLTQNIQKRHDKALSRLRDQIEGV